MNMIDRLDEIQARADNATDGPWQVSPDGPAEGYAGPIYTESDFTDVPELVSDGTWLPNAEFIAHARTDVPALVAALQAALVKCDRLEALAVMRDNPYDDFSRGARAAISEIRKPIEAALGGAA